MQWGVLWGLPTLGLVELRTLCHRNPDYGYQAFSDGHDRGHLEKVW